MRSGRLVSNIVVTRRTPGRVDNNGTPAETWAPVLTARAEIVSDSARAFLEDRGEVRGSSAVFRVRFREGIEPGDRVTIDGRASIAQRVFKIVECVEVVRRRVLELRCEWGHP